MKVRYLLGLSLIATVGSVIACGHNNTSETNTIGGHFPTPAPVEPVEPVEPQLEYQQLFTMEGRNADELFAAMFSPELDGKKTIEDNGSISCRLNIPTPIPNGIVAPTADCVGQTSASIANGIIAPWFTLSGFAGLDLYGKLPGQGDLKVLEGDLKIVCKSGLCIFFKAGGTEIPSFAVEGAAAEQIARSMSQFFGDDGIRDVQGNVTCRIRRPNIPDGAQGFFFPTAECSGHPYINDPRVGIVAPWFVLDGQLGLSLYTAMPVSDVDDVKSIDGVWTIQCDGSRCEFSVQ